MTAREAMEKHLKNALEGKVEEVAADLIPELLPALEELAPVLGKLAPTRFEIRGERQEGSDVAVKAALIGASGEMVVEDTWREVGGVWKVVKIQPL